MMEEGCSLTVLFVTDVSPTREKDKFARPQGHKLVKLVVPLVTWTHDTSRSSIRSIRIYVRQSRTKGKGVVRLRVHGTIKNATVTSSYRNLHKCCYTLVLLYTCI